MIENNLGILASDLIVTFKEKTLTDLESGYKLSFVGIVERSTLKIS